MNWISVKKSALLIITTTNAEPQNPKCKTKTKTLLSLSHRQHILWFQLGWASTLYSHQLTLQTRLICVVSTNQGLRFFLFCCEYHTRSQSNESTSLRANESLKSYQKCVFLQPQVQANLNFCSWVFFCCSLFYCFMMTNGEQTAKRKFFIFLNGMQTI